MAPRLPASCVPPAKRARGLDLAPPPGAGAPTNVPGPLLFPAESAGGTTMKPAVWSLMAVNVGPPPA